MRLLFVVDPIETFKIHKDTTYVMMREAQRRGHTVAVCEPQEIFWLRGGLVTAPMRTIALLDAPQEGQPWWQVLTEGEEALAHFDAVLMRKDPPFDSEFFYTTHLLTHLLLLLLQRWAWLLAWTVSAMRRVCWVAASGCLMVFRTNTSNRAKALSRRICARSGAAVMSLMINLACASAAKPRPEHPAHPP